MKTQFTKCSYTMRFTLILNMLILAGIYLNVQAQVPQFTRPSWWFGAAAGANFNFYRGTTQVLNADLTVPAAFHHGNGTGLYIAPLIEFYRPGSRWGAMLQAGYDNRKGSFNQVFSPCNCPADLSTDLSYITIEPSLRFAPFRSGLYLFGGPRFAFNVDKSFTFKQGTNPAYPEQPANPDVKGDFSNVRQVLVSMQVGAGYDIPLSSQDRHTQFVLSPFVSFHPYFGQDPRSAGSWNVTTLRTGIALKMGRGRKISPLEKALIPADVSDPEAHFFVNAPKNIPVARRVRETFPLRNYVFFNTGSTEIPQRYVLLRKEQVKDFKEDKLEMVNPKNLPGRSDRQMVVYYNILNILGDRMGKNTSTTITLVGSSEKGQEYGRAMATSVKGYLVSVFGINPSRITIETRDQPKISPAQPGGAHDLELLYEGNRRVAIESGSPALLMEFRNGPDAPLKPVEIIALQEAPVDSYVSFDAQGGKEAYASWSIEIKDEKGKVQYFGPFTRERMSIPGKSILGTRAEGNYKVTMVGQTKSGKTVRKDTTVHMVLWTPPTNEEGMRFSVIFEFNESKATAAYEKYLKEIVTPKIPKGATVIIHGYTDVIGDENHNQQLSLARANDVQHIMESSLLKSGRSDVKFDVYGFGENEALSQFDNKFPEERFYNRSVVIDIIPAR